MSGIVGYASRFPQVKGTSRAPGGDVDELDNDVAITASGRRNKTEMRG
jgi:hypothetical protein